MTQHPLGREAVLRRLKIYSKSGFSLADDDGSFAKWVAEETDRGAVILLASVVEDKLTDAVLSKMVALNSDEHSRLFGPDAPVGTFSAKIRMAYALGVIDRDLTKMCEILREMRNACAHSRRELSFDNAELRDALAVLWRCASDEDVFNFERRYCKLLLIWSAAYIMHAINSSSTDNAAEMVNRLISKATRLARRALLSSRRRQLSPSPPRSRSRRKGSRP